jgi:hypothetical protein
MTWICDFCSEEPITWSYPAQSFIAYVLGEVGGESVGDWACCDLCHSLIEANDTDGLARRAIETLTGRHPEMNLVRDELLLQMKILHQSFFKNRLGCALPFPRKADACAEPKSGL